MNTYLSKKSAHRAVIDAVKAGDLSMSAMVRIQRTKGVDKSREGFQGFIVRVRDADKEFVL